MTRAGQCAPICADGIGPFAGSNRMPAYDRSQVGAQSVSGFTGTPSFGGNCGQHLPALIVG
jgi:hypothetical protein